MYNLTTSLCEMGSKVSLSGDVVRILLLIKPVFVDFSIFDSGETLLRGIMLSRLIDFGKLCIHCVEITFSR